jgi:hypothetical protein
MARYRMDDGVIVDTKRATEHWDEKTRWNGNNHISVNTGSQWAHQRLYRSAKGRYWIECWSQWQGSLPYARWLDRAETAKWLLLNECDVPEDLADVLEAHSE